MKNLSLCVRGGGVKSATGIGTLLALKKLGIEVSRYSGTSIGAVIMALAAVGTPEEKIYEQFLEYVVLYSNGSRTRGGKGSSVIEETVNEKCGNITFKDLEKPLYIAANAGGLWFTKPFVFSRETTPNATLGQACRASCSFPLIYEHFEMNISGKKQKFWDGGMALNPYIPPKAENELSLVVSFQKEKPNMKSRYVSAWLKPEQDADILIKPYIGKMKTLGTPKDIETATMLGYHETMKCVETFRKVL